METVLVNAETKIRKITRNGRKILIARAVLIVPGVLPGSQGRLLYRAEDCAKRPRVWDGMPIVVNHPMVNNRPVTARTPEVIESYGVGFGFKTHFDGVLANEMHFDEEDLKRISPESHTAVEAGQKLELSTGLFTTNLPTPGEFEGTPYDGIATEHEPDHIAILTEGVGACSISRGCGVLANQMDDSTWLQRIATALKSLVSNVKLSHDELRMQLSGLIDKTYGGVAPQAGSGVMPDYPYVVDVFDKAVIYRSRGKNWRLGYSTDLRSGKISLEGEPVEVIRVSSYKPVANVSELWADTDTQNNPIDNPEPSNKGDDMATRTENITYLVANCDCWKSDEAKKDLDKLSDKQIETLVNQAKEFARLNQVHNAAVAGFSDQNGDSHRYDPQTGKFVTTPKTPVVNQNATPPQGGTGAVYPQTTTPVAKPVTDAEWLASAPPGIRSAVVNAQKVEQNEKAVLVARITANITDEARRKAESAWLMDKELPDLQRMVALIPEPNTAQQTQNTESDIPGLPSYQGAATLNGRTTDPDTDILEPAINIDWSKSPTAAVSSD